MLDDMKMFEGYLDFCNDVTLGGWCYKIDETDKLVELDIYVNNKFVETILASYFRRDLLEAQKGSGNHGFIYKIDSSNISRLDCYVVDVKVSGTDISLINSPAFVKNGRITKLKCYFPWVSIYVHDGGNVHTCECPSWLRDVNLSVGNLNESTIMDIWNGKMIKQYRKYFLDEKYDKFCRKDICPYLNGEYAQPTPGIKVLSAIANNKTEVDFGISKLSHDIDNGCNLKCAMCREDILHVNHQNVEKAVSDIKAIAFDGDLEYLNASGAGEVFLCREFIDLLASDTLSSINVKISLNTNLNVFTPKVWERIKHNNITISASVDGATKETYEKIRRGANWETVLRNLHYLSDLYNEGQINQPNLAFVIMLTNAHEVGKIIELTRQLNFNLSFLSQRGIMPSKEENIFESCNMEVLDRVYDIIDECGGFNMPHVVFTSSSILKKRQYRSVDYRINMAEYVMEQYRDEDMAIKIIIDCFDDIKRGVCNKNSIDVLRHSATVKVLRYKIYKKRISNKLNSIIGKG